MSKTTTKRNASRAARRFWLTPKGWNKRCHYCGETGCVAYRHRGRAYACKRCIEERGIVARESKSWREGGSRTDPTVTVRFANPASLQ
jgi:hypothetical protein